VSLVCPKLLGCNVNRRAESARWPFRQVAAWHEQALVAPLRGLATLTVDEAGALSCEGTALQPVGNLAHIEKLQRPVASALHVIGHARVTSDDETGTGPGHGDDRTAGRREPVVRASDGEVPIGEVVEHHGRPPDAPPRPDDRGELRTPAQACLRGQHLRRRASRDPCADGRR